MPFSEEGFWIPPAKAVDPFVNETAPIAARLVVLDCVGTFDLAIALASYPDYHPWQVIPPASSFDVPDPSMRLTRIILERDRSDESLAVDSANYAVLKDQAIAAAILAGKLPDLLQTVLDAIQVTPTPNLTEIEGAKLARWRERQLAFQQARANGARLAIEDLVREFDRQHTDVQAESHE